MNGSVGRVFAVMTLLCAAALGQDTKDTAPIVIVVPETPPQVGAPEQVSVAMKVVEFQATKGVDTGLSAFYARRKEPKTYGRVSDGEGAITTADLTFPIDTEGAITVFLDRLRLSDGDMEFVLQGLVNENRAFILSRPKAMVMVRNTAPTVIETVEENPYENPTVVGTTVVGVTDFRKTGVILQVGVPEVIDDDGDWTTLDDTFIKLQLLAEVKELGEDIVVAVDDRFAGANQVVAPTFVSRSMATNVWVRHGQVLILGGLYRNRNTKSLDSVPGLTKAEDLAVGLVERVIPGNFIGSPISSALGNRTSEEQRRELVFFIKCEVWRPAYTVVDESVFEDDEEPRGRIRPTDVIGDVIGGIAGIPEDIAEGIAGQESDDGIESELGGSPR
jgi:hypothetical protein